MRVGDLEPDIGKSTRLLCIVAHPDDEVLSGFGLISRVRHSGGEVKVCIVNNAGGLREELSKELAAHHGYEYAALPPDEFKAQDISVSRRLVEAIDAWMIDFRPTIVLTHGDYRGDHQQHRVVSEAVLICFCRYFTSERRGRLLFLPAFPYGVGFTPRVYLRLGEREKLAKSEALERQLKLGHKWYFEPSLHDRTAEENGYSYLGVVGLAVEVFGEEMSPPIRISSSEHDLRSRKSMADRSATSIQLTTPLRSGDPFSADALKLASEEYRVCSARADEIQRIIWQLFVASTALASVMAAALVKAIAETSSWAIACTALVSALLGLYLLAAWSRISEKWLAQSHYFYRRLDLLEWQLGYRTNGSTKDLDDSLQRKHRFYISMVRKRMAGAVAMFWSGLIGLCFWEVLSHIPYRFDEWLSVLASVGVGATAMVLHYLWSRAPGYEDVVNGETRDRSESGTTGMRT